MVGWHHQLDGHEFEQALGNGEGQGSLEHSSSWGCRVRHTQQMITAVCPTALAQRHLRNAPQAREREREREAGLLCWGWSRRSYASLLSQAMSTSLCPGPQEAECKREGFTSFNARCCRCPVGTLWGKHLTSKPHSLPPSVNQR